MADVIIFPGVGVGENGANVPEISARALADSVGLAKADEAEIEGYSHSTLDAAGELYGQTAIDEFEGHRQAAIAALERAKQFVIGQGLIERAERILGPRRALLTGQAMDEHRRHVLGELIDADGNGLSDVVCSAWAAELQWLHRVGAATVDDWGFYQIFRVTPFGRAMIVTDDDPEAA